MTTTVQEEPPYAKAIAALRGARRHGQLLLWSFAAACLLFYFLSPTLFALMQAHLDQELVFFTVAGPFLAHVKVAVAAALFSLAPLFAFCLWRVLAAPFSLTGRNVFWFTAGSCLLFYSGALFCYFVTLPYGIDFLLGFGSSELQPVISVNKFVVFVTVFVLAFGLIFELPILMVFAARGRLISRDAFSRNRRYAILIISIAAALLTPTPDVVNMMLMGLPLYGLYEAGILLLRLLKIQ